MVLIVAVIVLWVVVGGVEMFEHVEKMEVGEEDFLIPLTKSLYLFDHSYPLVQTGILKIRERGFYWLHL